MKRRLFIASVAVVAGSFVFGGAQAGAVSDPDSHANGVSAFVVDLSAHVLALDDPFDESAADYTGTIGVADADVGPNAAPAPAASPSDPKLLVDDDKVQCPNAPYMRIQDAVDAAGPNDTIKVCPGTYNEQVRIGSGRDGLKLESVKPLQAIIKWPAIETFPLALVDINGSDRVRLRGFTVTGPFTFPACSLDRHEGILVEDSFNDRIERNHITMIQNANPTLYGCQEGDAVSIGRRAGACGTGVVPGSARLEHNLIDEYQKNGVQVVNPGSFGDVDHNDITGSSVPAVRAIIASNGVVVCDAGARIHHNKVSGNQFTPTPLSTGIILSGAPSGSVVDHNRVFDNDFGIDADTGSGAKVSHNDVFGNLGDGITLDTLTNSTVDGNKVDDNAGSGISLFDADSNLLKSNQVEDNGTAGADMTDGLRVDMNSSNNQIRDNHMDDNVTHDCHDDSNGSGSGTPPTANFWIGDKGDTQNRLGLCKH
jgi:parallel beta-helix repeat protein